MDTALHHLRSLRTMVIAVSLLAVLLIGAVLAMGARGASAMASPAQPLLCFMVQGNDDRTLTLVPANDDDATSYDVASNYDSATGNFSLISTLAANATLNLKVGNVAHWVRSSNAGGDSGWLRCDSYRKISYIAVEDLIDYRRRSANVAVGLDNNGTTPTTNSYREFEGEDDDIVVVAVANTAGLEPNNKKMAWRVKFRISAADVAALQAAGAGEISWNLMQRGFADDPGGQWKMSLVSKAGSDVRVQCTTQDGRAGAVGRMQVESTVDVASLSIQDGYTRWIVATCFADDSGQSQGPGGVRGDGLQVVVNGQTGTESVFPGLGTITPSGASSCQAGGMPLDPNLFPGGISGVFTIGNKPACFGPNTPDDRFRGHIDYAEVFKQ